MRFIHLQIFYLINIQRKVWDWVLDVDLCLVKHFSQRSFGKVYWEGGAKF